MTGDVPLVSEGTGIKSVTEVRDESIDRVTLYLISVSRLERYILSSNEAKMYGPARTMNKTARMTMRVLSVLSLKIFAPPCCTE